VGFGFLAVLLNKIGFLNGLISQVRFLQQFN